MNRVRLSRSRSMNLNASPEAVFPLLCPVREYDWIPVWSCELVHTRSGVAELDCVFKTNFPADGPGEDTWVVSRYEPSKCIEFVRVNSLRTMRYAIELEPDGKGGTKAVWTQLITALNDAGDKWLAKQDGAKFAEKIKGLEAMLNHYLTTGKMLKID